jgi:hypothetical protein
VHEIGRLREQQQHAIARRGLARQPRRNAQRIAQQRTVIRAFADGFVAGDESVGRRIAGTIRAIDEQIAEIAVRKGIPAHRFHSRNFQEKNEITSCRRDLRGVETVSGGSARGSRALA